MDDALKKTLSFKFRIIAISVLHNNIDELTEFVKKIKQKKKNFIVLVGGQAISQYHSSPKYKEAIKNVDSFFIGESETNFPVVVEKIVNNIYWKDTDGIGYFENENITINKPSRIISELDELPLQDRDILREIIDITPNFNECSVAIGRGCNYRCTFCSYFTLSKLNEGKYHHRRRSAKNVFNEIDYLYNDFGIRSFILEDENLFDDEPNNIRNIGLLCSKLKAFDKDISLSAWGRIANINISLLEKLIEVGLDSLFIGVDSFNNSELKLFNKGYDNELADCVLKKVLNLGFSMEIDSKLRLRLGYIMWTPYSTIETLSKSVEYLQKYKATPKMLQHILKTYEVSPITKKIKRDGLIKIDDYSQESESILWEFKSPEIATIFDFTMNFSKKWSKLRGAIRLIEKFVIAENLEGLSKLIDMKRKRLKLDNLFWEYFGELINSENNKLDYNDIYKDFMNKTSQIYTENDEVLLIDFLSEHSMLGNYDMINVNMPWTTRYRRG